MESQTHSKGGRPTKYDPKYVDEIIEYFEEFVDEPFTKEVVREERTFYEKTGGVKSERVEHKFISKRLPTLFGFARKIGTTYTTVYRWTEERIGKAPAEGEKDTRPYRYPEFRNAYKMRVLYQTEFLTAVGLGGIAPANAFIFTSKNILGWRDATEQRLVDKDGKDRPLPSYVLLPARKSEEESQQEFAAQESEATAGP